MACALHPDLVSQRVEHTHFLPVLSLNLLAKCDVYTLGWGVQAKSRVLHSRV